MPHRWVARNWIAVGVAAALVAAPVLAHSNAKHQAESQSKATATRSYENCLTASPRTATNVAFQKAAASVRRAAGEELVADKYDALAQLQTDTILAPKGYEGSPELVEVSFHREGKKLVARLSAHSQELLKEGCRPAYRLP